MYFIDCVILRAWIFSGKFRLLRCEYHFFLFTHQQSQKNPVSASAMLTRNFLRIRRVFSNSESFCNKMKNLRTFWKMSGYYTKYPDNMQCVRMDWKVSG